MPKPTAQDVIELLQQLIKLLGTDAFGQMDWTQFYSGPQNKIIRELFGKSAKRITSAYKNRGNNPKSKRQAKEYKATLIDDTAPGKLADTVRVYEFFRKHYFPDYIAAANEADKVMRWLSREFSSAANGHVLTAVCGADKARVFLDTELPELLVNTKVLTINGIKREILNDIYFSTPTDPSEGQNKAFRLICLAELRISLRKAWKDATVEAVRNYTDRKSFYQIDQREKLKASGKPMSLILNLSYRQRHARNASLRVRILSSRPTPAPTVRRTGTGRIKAARVHI